MTEAGDRWSHALLAIKLLALEPRLGGIALRARAGPVRDRWCAALARYPLPLRKLPLNISDEQLYGGLDLAATLATGQEVRTAGLLANQSLIMIPMAERMEPGLAARMGQVIDAGGHAVVALDEGVDEQEGLPHALRDRLAFQIDLDGVACGAASAAFGTLPEPMDVTTGEAHIAAIAELAESLAVASPRAAIQCLWAAQAHAALHRQRAVRSEDVEIAAILTLAPRATRIPEPAETKPPDPPARQDHEEQSEADGNTLDIPQELLLEAVRAVLPTDILAQVAARRARRGAKGTGAGAKRTSNRKGRPLASRAGRLDGRARLDLVATLRAAAPFQSIRKAQTHRDRPVEIRASDIRLKRFEERSDRLLVFAVDASGSAALARLAEAKGAIELLLAEAYARRDHVSLVGFRGVRADILLPPTRSLVQTKKRLAALPGGGGTPLAAGIKAAAELALQGRARGMTPTLILLTDGRANVALDGEADRKRAAHDASHMAQVAFVQGVEALVIDVGRRPERSLRTLAESMDATYLPLPRADAERLSAAVSGALN